MWIFLNDRFLPREQAVVSIFDHGFLYGDGVYETMRSYDNRIFMLNHHLARLRRSASLIGLELPIPEKDWPGLLHEAMERNQLRDAYLRVAVSRGEGEIGLDPKLCPRPTTVIITKPLPQYPPQIFAEGVSLAVVSVRRNLVSALSPQIKSFNFLNNILAKQESTRLGAYDALMLNAHGYVTECTTSNLFFVKEGTLCTPSLEAGILDGITRECLLLLAREQGLRIHQALFTPEEVRQADECFLTSTTVEVLPVRSLDQGPIGKKCPGPMTTKLRSLFQASVPRFLE